MNAVAMRPVTEEFLEAARLAVMKARQVKDDAIRYMGQAIPIYAQWDATPEMAGAGGCPRCTYLGLWTERWVDYQNSRHGLIILFERGIRYMGRDLWTQTYDTLLHEFDHALQKDHVLTALEERTRAQTSGGCGG